MDTNREHHITPSDVSRAVQESLATYESKRAAGVSVLKDAAMEVELTETISELETEML